ncbi:MAG: NHL repeat-containing protein [Desulfobulbaceae bacterium]|nr:NHL repeat-containing protein [Desulfobulbaceae bacterium]
MRKIAVLSVLLLLNCLFAGFSLAASPLKIKFLQSVYEDNGGTGLKSPEGVACTDDYFIAADTGNNRLVKYAFKDNTVGAMEFEIPVTAPLIAQINSDGDIYALDGRDRRIQIFNADGQAKGTLSAKGAPVAAKMVPRSFKIDENNNIYILDISEEVVLVLDSSGKYLKHIPLPEQGGFFSDLAVDRQGIVYVVDSVHPGVYSSAPEGDTFSLITKNLQEFVNFPATITLDNQGVIFLMDKHGGSLALLGRNGSFLGHKFGYGWREGQFYYPAQICVNQAKNIFIADRNNSRVQIFATEE